MELTSELIIKHKKALLEADATVKSYQKRSKTGKAFTVKQHSRHLSVTHMGEKFKLDNDAHPARHIMILRKIAVREFNLADRIESRMDWHKTKADRADAVARAEAAKKRGLAATDLIQHIFSGNKDLLSGHYPKAQGVAGAKKSPEKGGAELAMSYNALRKRIKDNPGITG